MRVIAPDLVGNEPARHYLRRIADRSAAQGSYLFVGPPGVGKTTTALAFAQTIQCLTSVERAPCGTCASCRAWLHGVHPDALHVRTLEERRAILIDQIRPTPESDVPAEDTVYRRLQLTAALAPRQVVIIESADQLNLASANALLKTLEEPRGNTVLILTAMNIHALPATIVSRCATIYFQRVPSAAILTLLKADTSLSAEQRHLAVGLANGRPGIARAFAEDPAELEHQLDELRTTLQCLQQASSAPFQFTDTLLPKSRERAHKVLPQLLQYLAIIIRDLVYAASGETRQLTLKRYHASIQTLASHATSSALVAIGAAYATLTRRIASNVAPRTAFDAFTNTFAEHVHAR